MDKSVETNKEYLELVVRLELRLKAGEYTFNRQDVKDAVATGLEQHLPGMDGCQVIDLDERETSAALDMQAFNTIMATLENEREPEIRR